MMESTWQGNEFGKLFESWMEVSKNFWQADTLQAEADRRTAAKDDTGSNNDAGDREEKQNGEDSKFKTYRNWETMANNFTSFLKIMSAPENQKELGDGLLAFSKVMTQATGDALENITDFQGQLINSFAKVNEHTKAYNFDDIDHAAFESFRDLYRTEFQKYLKMPKIGLPREFHERLSNLADSSNLFYSYLTEFIYLLFQPLEKTNRVMQQRVNQMLEKGDFEFIKDSKKGYSEWIKALEGNFMEMLNSDEYTEVLNKTIVSLAALKSVRREVMGIILKDLQIPTNKEMDEVYKDLYQMKKQVRQLSRQVESLQAELKAARN